MIEKERNKEREMEYREGNEIKKRKWNIGKEMKHRKGNGIQRRK